MQILNGKYYNRAIECHRMTLQDLADMFFETVFKDNLDAYTTLCQSVQRLIISEAVKSFDNVPMVHRELLLAMEFLNIEPLVSDCDAKNQKYPVYQWFCMYMKQGLSMLSILQATRQHHGNYICHHLNKYAYRFLLMTYTTRADIFPNT